ncbi:hypothetical protein C2R84_06000 [Helicobacter pylori]|nr:hypothetical protein C2R84_06000 [Helicobacter pylori]
MGVTKKASLILMIKKRLKLRAKRPNPFNGSSFLKQIDNHNIVKSLVQRLMAERFYSPIRALIVFQTSKSFK